MALTDESNGNGFYMPVAPAYGGGNGGFGGGFGGDWGWIILLLLCGWGGFGGGYGGGYGGMMLGYDFPWLLSGQNGINTHVSDGFRDQMLQTSISSVGDKVTSGFGDIQTALCGGFAGVNASIANAAAQAEISANSRQMANMNQVFGLSTQLADCCCENRLASADLKYTITTENCADRAALSDGIRDVIANQTASTQAVLDKLCQLELDGYKREADSLRSQLSEARLAASQTAQNAFISQGFANEVDALYNRLNSCPVPTTPVYGRTPIFTCNQNSCGCGCGNGAF